MHFQMVAVMKKLTAGAMISPNGAAEEFHEGAQGKGIQDSVLFCRVLLVQNIMPYR